MTEAEQVRVLREALIKARPYVIEAMRSGPNGKALTVAIKTANAIDAALSATGGER